MQRIEIKLKVKGQIRVHSPKSLCAFPLKPHAKFKFKCLCILMICSTYNLHSINVLDVYFLCFCIHCTSDMCTFDRFLRFLVFSVLMLIKNICDIT